MLVVGGPDTGKTVSVLQPLLLDYPGSLFIYDPKGTLWGYTYDDGTAYDFAAYRRTLGRVVRYAPTRADSDCYNPLAALDVRDEAELVRQAGLLAELLLEPERERRTSDAGQHYGGHAYTLLKAELLLGAETGIATTGAKILEMHVTDWKTLVGNMQVSELEALRVAGLEMSQWKDVRMISGTRQTVSRALEIFTDPLVARMTSQSSVRMEDLRNGDQPCTVYLHVPFEDLARLRPLVRIIVHQHLLYNGVVKPWKRRLPFILEELPSLQHLGTVSEGLNFLRESGVQLVCVTPSLKEITHWYGPSHNFLESARTQLFFGISDPEVAQDISRRIGTHSVVENGREVERPLLSATGVQQLGEDQVLLVHGRYARILTQARFYQRPSWVRRAYVQQ